MTYEAETPFLDNQPFKMHENKNINIFKAGGMHLSNSLEQLLSNIANTLRIMSYGEPAAEIESIIKDANRERFKILVVGEFNRGKSTFINNFLGRDILPVGNLPTTAVITRIIYHPNNILSAFDVKNRLLFEKPLTLDAWEGLTAANFTGRDFQGSVLIGLNFQWLGSTNIELVDTPGIGDLEEQRARAVGDALLGYDGVVVAVDANQLLSMTERTLIEERLAARKFPFIMLIITKMEQISEAERPTIIQYALNKLKNWGLNIPIFISDNISMPDKEYTNMIGMDKIKSQMEEWALFPQRTAIIEKWILGRTEAVLTSVLSSLREKSLLLEAKKKEEHKVLLEQKEQMLAQAELHWGDLRLEMQRRCTSCYDLFLKKVNECTDDLVERLQFQVQHAPSPDQWWEKDFPYCLKVELTNLSSSIESVVSRRLQEDGYWYGNAIEKSFHTNVLFKRGPIIEKEMFGNFAIEKNINFEDINNKRNKLLAGAAVVGVSGMILFSGMAFLPLIASAGVATGSKILAERITQKKIEEQRQMAEKEIARCVPIFIQNSINESESRLQQLYQDMLNEAKKRQEEWVRIQKQAIKEANNLNDEANKDNISESISKIEEQIAALRKIDLSL